MRIGIQYRSTEELLKREKCPFLECIENPSGLYTHEGFHYEKRCTQNPDG